MDYNLGVDPCRRIPDLCGRISDPCGRISDPCGRMSDPYGGAPDRVSINHLWSRCFSERARSLKSGATEACGDLIRPRNLTGGWCCCMRVYCCIKSCMWSLMRISLRYLFIFSFNFRREMKTYFSEKNKDWIVIKIHFSCKRKKKKGGGGSHILYIFVFKPHLLLAL